MNIEHILNLNTPCQRVYLPDFEKLGIHFSIKRDDLIHPFISGNKWRKLVLNVKSALGLGATGITTYGGAYSNHILATAFAASAVGLKSTGLIRGPELSAKSNHILKLAEHLGMNLHFISRSEYKLEADNKKGLCGEEYFIPQGGANELGIQGCKSILLNTTPADHIVVASGTGTTAIGIGLSLSKRQHLHIVDCVGHDTQVLPRIEEALEPSKFSFHSDFANGGFGMYDKELIQENGAFAMKTGILLDPIYTGKVVQAIKGLASRGIFKKGQSVLMIHTGGLTGILSQKWLNV